MLTDAKCRNAKPADKPFKLADGGGLHLFVSPAGGRTWRFRYERTGVERLLTIGPYPAISLADARAARDTAKALLRAGQDPCAAKKDARVPVAIAFERGFEAIAREWHALHVPAWTARHAKEVLDSLAAHVFPAIGAKHLSLIKPPEVLEVIRAIEARPAVETARRVRQRISAVFCYAVAAGLCENDPAAPVKGALAPLKRSRQPALVELSDARDVLARAEAVPAHPATRLALRFLALTAVRPGEVRGARWSEFDGLDGDSPVWRIPAERMKMKRVHVVPLSGAALDVLTAARSIAGGAALVFPSSRHAHRPLSENAMGYLLNRAGYHHRHVPHGWRATFSTVMNERFPADRAVIDLMLAHLPKDHTEAAYNRAAHMKRRRELAVEWADLLSSGLAPAADLIEGARR